MELRFRELHEVRERDYFFIVSFSVWGLWAGMGIATLWKEAAMELKASLARTVPILGLAFIPLVAHWSWASRADDYSARDRAYNLLMSVEPYGILFTNGDNDTFPLWYLQEVEGTRKDVTVIVTSYLNMPWYTKQLRDLTRPCPEGTAADDEPSVILCQRPYTADNTGAAYVTDPAQAGEKVPLLLSESVRAPTRSILPLDDAPIDRVARSYSRIEQDQGPSAWARSQTSSARSHRIWPSWATGWTCLARGRWWRKPSPTAPGSRTGGAIGPTRPPSESPTTTPGPTWL